MKKFYVYIHSYILENGEKYVLYVGKGNGKRAYDFNNRNEIHKKYVKKHGNPFVEIVKYFKDEQDAYNLERRLRKYYYDLGQAIASKDINIIGDNNYWRQNGISKEIRKKISNSLKGNKLSEETKNKISAKSAGKNNGMYGKGYLLKGKGNKKVILIDENNKIVFEANSVNEMKDFFKEKYDISSSTVKKFLKSGEPIHSKYEKINQLKNHKLAYV